MAYKLIVNGQTIELRGTSALNLIGKLNSLATVSLSAGNDPQTTDATATTVATLPVAASGSTFAAVYVTGTQSDGSNIFSQLSANHAVRLGGAAPTLSSGATGIIVAAVTNTFAIVRPTFQYVISGNNLLLQVVGKAATTINWNVYYIALSR